MDTTVQPTEATQIQQQPVQEASTSQNVSPVKNTNERHISLVNFDPNGKARKFLNSPRSVEAMKRLCFEDHELLAKTEDDFAREPVPLEFKEEKEFFYKVKAEHYEKRRNQKLRLAIQERISIIQGNGNDKTSMEHGSVTGENNGSVQASYFNTEYMVQQEKKKIQQMKNQQKKEIDLIINNEMRVQEMHKKNQIKVARMADREAKRQAEVEAHQREAEEAKQKREQKKIARDREIEEQNQIMFEKKKQEDMRRLEVLERIKEEQAAEVIRRERERKQKAVVREKRIEEIEVEKREQVEKKREEREEKFYRIKEEQEHQQRQKHMQSEQARRGFEQKIAAVRERVAVSKEEQRVRVFEKQVLTNQKRERFEEQKRRELDDRRNRSEAKLQEIRRTLDIKFAEEQQKKSAYLYKYKQAEDNKRDREASLEAERLAKIQQEHEKQQRIKAILHQNEAEMFAKNQAFLQTLTHEIGEVEKRRDQNLKELKKKYIQDILKMEDAYENTKRLEKIREIKKNEYLTKMHAESERLQHFQNERENAAREKKKLQDQLEAEKAATLKEFEKQKKLLMHANASDMSLELKTDHNSVENSVITSTKSPGHINPRASTGPQSTTKSARTVRPSGFNPEKSVEKSKLSANPSTTKLEEIKTLSANPSAANLQDSKLTSSDNTKSVSKLEDSKVSEKKPTKTPALKPVQKPTPKPVVITTQKPVTVTGTVKATPIKKVEQKPVKATYISEVQSAKSANINEQLSSKLVAKDSLMTELQTKEYEGLSQDLRKNQAAELLKLLEDAVREDKDQKSTEKNLGKFIDLTQKHEEEINKTRTQNNFLLLA